MEILTQGLLKTILIFRLLKKVPTNILSVYNNYPHAFVYPRMKILPKKSCHKNISYVTYYDCQKLTAVTLWKSEM